MDFEKCGERQHRRSADGFDAVEEGVEAFMRKRHHADERIAPERHAKFAPATPTADTNKRGGGKGRGWVGGWVGGCPAQETEVWVWRSSS